MTIFLVLAVEILNIFFKNGGHFWTKLTDISITVLIKSNLENTLYRFISTKSNARTLF
jgi:hypothetical protein